MKKISILFLFFLAIYGCDPCKDVDCNNQGSCSDGNCECNPGWTGDNCETDMCASVNCDHGNCVEGSCDCDDNWTGDLCDECATNCGAHGDCNDAGDCVCTDDYTGDSCQIAPVTGICSDACGVGNEWVGDGACDDGGPGSDYNVCGCGTDCTDCGERSTSDCASGGDGYLGVWTALSTFPCVTALIDVYVDDVYEGSIDSYFSSAPDCGDEDVVTVALSEGSHTLYAECNNGETYWGPGSITISDGMCTLIELQEKKNFVEERKSHVKK